MRVVFTILFLFSVAYGQQTVIPVRDSIVYDFTGATRKGSPGLYKYFGPNITDDGRITRAVADFNRDSLGGRGWKGMINLQEEWTISTDSAIVFYDPSGSRDTMDLYFFDKDNAPKWDTIINTHLYTPTYHIVSCGTCAGTPVTTVLTSPAGRKVQFILVVVHRTNLFSGLWPDIRKIQFRGVKTGNKDTTYNLAPWAMQTWTPRKISEISNNVNLQNQQDTLWSDTALVDYGYVRTFDQMFFDDQNVPHGSQAINAGGGGFTAFKYQQQLASKGHYQWAAIFNDNAYFIAQEVAAYGSHTKSWGTNTLTDDPQLPASYSRKGHYMHALAEAGGSCTGCPKTTVWYNGTPLLNGGYLKVLGTSNEPTGFFAPNAWKTPIEVAAEGLGVADSVHTADPNILVFLAGFEAYNYDDAKAAIMLMKLHERSRNIKIDGVDFHAMSTKILDAYEVSPTTSQQVYNYGVSPGYWDDWRKNNHYLNGMRREAGSITLKVAITEDTYQKGYYKYKPMDAGETFSVSQLAAPNYVLGGILQDRLQCHGIGALQKEFIASASGLYQYYWYTGVDEIVMSNNPGWDAIDGNNGKFRRPETFGPPPTAWPAHWGVASRRRRIGNYVFSDTISYTKGGLAVFKYKNASNPDSLLFEYAVLDSMATASFTIPTASVGGATLGKIWVPSFFNYNEGFGALAASGGNFSFNADPLPRQFIVYAPSGGNVSPNADAGADQSITLPTSSVTLNGSASSDPDGTITAYAWTKISGPSGLTIVSPSSASTNVTGLVAGTYVFQLQVTDNGSATDTDTVTITVNPAVIGPDPVGEFIIIRRKSKVAAHQ